MELLTGERLHTAISEVLSGERAHCAVAFWGRGSEPLVLGKRDARVICNLQMGGTNPKVIEQLLRSSVAVRQMDDLHAKVYIGTEWAVVTSANASINGLGIESETASWLEAGTRLPATAATPWFDAIWQRGREITGDDLLRASIEFFRRQMREVLDAEEDGALVIDIHGLSVRKAAELVLSMNRMSMSAHSIANELQKVGFPTAAPQLHRSVTDAIRDGMDRGHFVRTDRGLYGLGAWPENAELAAAAIEAAKLRPPTRRDRSSPIDPVLSERVRAGLAAARARGVSGGSKLKLSDEQLQELIAKRRAGVSKQMLATEFGFSLPGMIKLLGRLLPPSPRKPRSPASIQVPSIPADGSAD